MSDDRHGQAVDTLAASIVARAADTEIRDSRLEYADVGEHDWKRIADAVQRIAPFPDPNAVDDAVEYLCRTRGREATP